MLTRYNSIWSLDGWSFELGDQEPNSGEHPTQSSLSTCERKEYEVWDFGWNSQALEKPLQQQINIMVLVWL